MSSSMVLSLSSNCLSLRSVHKHHIRQQGTIFHTTALRERPPDHQQANKSITRKGKKTVLYKNRKEEIPNKVTNTMGLAIFHCLSLALI